MSEFLETKRTVTNNLIIGTALAAPSASSTFPTSC